MLDFSNLIKYDDLLNLSYYLSYYLSYFLSYYLSTTFLLPLYYLSTTSLDHRAYSFGLGWRPLPDWSLQ